MMLSLAWIAGFAGVLVWLSRAGRSARTRALESVSRATVILAAVAVAALGFSSAYVFGARVARTGMDKILAQRGEPGSESDSTHQRSAEPPRARLFLRHVQLQLAPAGADGGGHQALIGYSPEAAMRLPRGYGLDEAKQGWDLLRVRAVGPQGLRVEPVTHPEATTTRVLAHAERRAIGDVPSPESIAMAARSLTGRGGRRCGDPGAPAAEQASAELDGPGALFVIICQARSPTAALVLERDLLDPDVGFQQIPVRVTPLVWRGGSWRPHHVQISSGSLLQIGTMVDALPGVTLWEVPAPAGRAELFYPPDNLLASCPEWLSGRRRQGFYSYPGRAASADISSASDPAASLLEAPTESRAGDSICVLPFTPPFGLEVRRLLPDVPGVGARSFWVAGLMTTPALLFLLLLCARPRSQISRERFRRLLTLGWIACLFAAIGVWRLSWAHRIDMLRDYESVGPRVLQNQVVLVLGAAALAATGVLAWFARDRRRSWRALAGAFGGWLVWLAIGGYALRGDWAGVGLHGRLVGQSALSLAIGTGLFWLPHWQRALGHVRGGLLARRLPGWLTDPRTREWIVPMAGLGALCIAMILADALAPRAVLLKLALAWLFVVAVYSALRASIGPYDMATGRASAAFALGGVGALLLARFDPGVTVAIAGPGLLASLLFASHDARFADSSLRKMASYQRHHAPLLLAHAGLLVALGVFVIGWSLAGLWATTAHEPDAMLARACTMGAIYSTLFFAALFVAAAVVSYLRRGLRAAIPWLLVSALMGGLFLARDAIIDRVLAGSSQAAHRIAIVLDPGYALLHDESKFSSGITAWRETIMPAATATPAAGERAWRFTELLDGQGYFGAQLIDPGVLLSVENDYFPVLLVRESGIQGLLITALLSLILVAGLWIEAGDRFRHGSDQQRTRALVSLVLGVVCVYQPLASLGVLPLTGISWPGFGLDSPSDFWVLMTIVVWVLMWGERPLDDQALDEFDRELRTSRLFRKMRAVVAVTAAVVVVASLLLCARAAAFALRRPNPVDPSGRTVKPFDSLERAVDYAFHLQCPWTERVVDTRSGRAADWAAALVPDDLLGDASPGGVFRFHSALRAAWQAHRARAIDEVAAFLEHRPSCGRGKARRAGPWTFEPSPENPDECRMRFKTGWPEIELVIERDDQDAPDQSDEDAADRSPDEGRARAHSATCGVDVRTDIVRTLRFPARRPYRDSRIRLVARAMGDAARDRGELISGHLIVRLRDGAGTVDVSRARSGWQAAQEVHISNDLVIALEDGRTVLRRTAPAPAQAAAGDEQAWLLMREPPNQRDLRSVQVLEAEQGSWKLLSADRDTVALERLALLVIGRPDARSLWLFRPPSAWPGEEGETVDPLFADDISTVRGERRRHYLFGGLVPEIGWVNPFHARMSLGLDGWVRVAMSEYEDRGPRPGAAGQRGRAPTWLDRGGEVPYCATLAPVSVSGEPGQPGTSAGTGAAGPLSQKTGLDGALDTTLARICRHSPLDGVLECRVSVQPELNIRLRHLTELISLDPARYSGDARASLPARANFALMRGDTGEIVAQGEFVPGRASSAYAPATPEIEQYLIRLREDRDPKTGRRLEDRGEASAEKIDWNRPIAVGSTMKPLMGHALELADPGFSRALVIEGSKIAGALCRRMKAHAIFGHCPPTDSLWGGYNGLTDMSRFISASVNWYQAAVGLIGTAAGERGTFGFGGDQTPATLDAVIARNVGDYRLDTALWTNHRGQPVILADRTMRLDHLRETPLWSHFEAVLGRPLCGLGQKAACERQSARKDLCAARALPIDKPTSDLRHLVALGPSTFDFYPRLRDPERRVGASVSTREYLQFLRGSGLHPLGSLLQLTDAFNRVVYEFGGTPLEQSQKIGFTLAASWFPVAARGRTPARSCADASLERDVSAGLCEVVRTGTAEDALGPLLGDPRFAIYGAKTGTIDSLADVAEDPSACAHYAIGHTIPDQPADAAKQPYWLPCTKNRNALRSVNDSLLMISFAVRGDDGESVPLTLGLRFQRSGSGLATRVARHYLDVIHDYFAPTPTPTDQLSDDPNQP